MPTYDARSAHEVDVRADPATVYQALLTTDFGRNPVVAALMAVQAIPAVLLSPHRALERQAAPGPPDSSASMAACTRAGNVGGSARALAALAACALMLQCSAPAGVVPAELEELVPGFAYDAWFTDHTGFTVNPGAFGAYTIQPMAGTLYLGFGADRPVLRDGALLAAFDDQGLRAIAPLDEQGILDMTVANETLLIPGVDPCCPDGWESGNFYLYHPGTGLIKRRNLPNVLHAWGTWYDAGENAIYLAASAHPGDFLTSIGQIWRTGDEGRNWELVADGNDGVGSYRTYDVIGHQGALFAVSRADVCTLVARPPGQTTWVDVLPGSRVACGPRLVGFDGRLIAFDVDRSAFHVLPPDGAPSRVNVPFTVDTVAYNWAAVAGGFLYVISDDGRILVTRDLVAWETVVWSNQSFSAIQYWPDRNWLVLATYGRGGAVWKLQLCHTAPC